MTTEKTMIPSEKYVGHTEIGRRFTFSADHGITLFHFDVVRSNLFHDRHPILLAYSLLLSKDDIEHVNIGNYTEISGITSNEEAEDMEDIEVNIYRDMIEIYGWMKNVREMKHCKFPIQPFLNELLSFMNEGDDEWLTSVPEPIELRTEEYNGGLMGQIIWDYTDDPLRKNNPDLVSGEQLSGWMENEDGTRLVYISSRLTTWEGIDVWTVIEGKRGEDCDDIVDMDVRDWADVITLTPR